MSKGEAMHQLSGRAGSRKTLLATEAQSYSLKAMLFAASVLKPEAQAIVGSEPVAAAAVNSGVITASNFNSGALVTVGCTSPDDLWDSLVKNESVDGVVRIPSLAYYALSRSNLFVTNDKTVLQFGSGMSDSQQLFTSARRDDEDPNVIHVATCFHTDNERLFDVIRTPNDFMVSGSTLPKLLDERSSRFVYVIARINRTSGVDAAKFDTLRITEAFVSVNCFTDHVKLTAADFPLFMVEGFVNLPRSFLGFKDAKLPFCVYPRLESDLLAELRDITQESDEKLAMATDEDLARLASSVILFIRNQISGEFKEAIDFTDGLTLVGLRLMKRYTDQFAIFARSVRIVVEAVTQGGSLDDGNHEDRFLIGSSDESAHSFTAHCITTARDLNRRVQTKNLRVSTFPFDIIDHRYVIDSMLALAFSQSEGAAAASGGVSTDLFEFLTSKTMNDSIILTPSESVIPNIERYEPLLSGQLICYTDDRGKLHQPIVATSRRTWRSRLHILFSVIDTWTDPNSGCKFKIIARSDDTYDGFIFTVSRQRDSHISYRIFRESPNGPQCFSYSEMVCTALDAVDALRSAGHCDDDESGIDEDFDNQLMSFDLVNGVEKTSDTRAMPCIIPVVNDSTRALIEAMFDGENTHDVDELGNLTQSLESSTVAGGDSNG
jgi:hypothetical protein